MTIPNVLLNYPDEKEEVVKRCRFLSGDWSLLERFVKESDLAVK